MTRRRSQLFLAGLDGSAGHSNARLPFAGVRWKSGLCLRADVGGHHKPGISRRKVRMVKTRLAQWISRWRERRLAREQTRQTPATRQATRDTQAQRYRSTGHGP